MNGGEIFTFSLREVPSAIERVLQKANLRREDVDLFILHQANAYMLDCLKRKCRIPSENFYKWFSVTGNTVSNTIPIALHHALAEGRIHCGSTVIFVGFGVGLSWGACVARL